MKVLVDEMREGIDERLKSHGYEAYSARKLFLKGEKIHSDYSILKFAERNHMVLITEEVDNIEGCKENHIEYVEFGQKHDSFELLLEQLKELNMKLEADRQRTKVKDVREGIDYCLNSGRRLIEDARILQHRKKYRSAIPLYVLGYEELGKALFLIGKLIRGDDVYESDLRELMRGADSHLNKLSIDKLQITDMVSQLSESQFEEAKNSAKRDNIPFTQFNREGFLKLHDETSKIFGKFHKLKMAFLYTDYRNGSWSTPKFSEKALNALCEYLYHETIRPFYSGSLWMIIHALQVKVGKLELNEEDTKKWKNSEPSQKILEQKHTYRTRAFINNYLTAKNMIESL